MHRGPEAAGETGKLKELATPALSNAWASKDSNLNTNDLVAFGWLGAQWNKHDTNWLPVVDSNHDSRIQRPLSYAKFGTAAYRGMIPLSSSITILWFAGTLPKCCRGPLGHSTSMEETAVSLPRPNVSGSSLCEQ